MRKLSLIAILSSFLFSCGGGGGGSQDYLITGTVEASKIVNLKVCTEDLQSCTYTGTDGSFRLLSPIPNPTLRFFVNGTEGEVELADYTIKKSGEIITPFKMTENDYKSSLVLAKIIHALGNDTTGNASSIYLGNVTIENVVFNSIPENTTGTTVEELIKKSIEENATLNLSFNVGSTQKVVSVYSNGTVSLCDNGNSNCQEVNYTYKWLILIYMDGDNSLDSAADKDLGELSQVYYPPDVKVIVLVDKLNTMGGEIYESKDGIFQKVKDISEPNMGTSDTLVNFVKDSILNSKYSFQNTALIMWNHGDGWRGQVYDYGRSAAQDQTNNDYLLMFELKEALQQLKSEGYNLSLIGFDECLMGMVEVLYDIKDYANAFVASEAEEPFDGWNYTKVMTKLISNPNADAYTFGKYIVDAFNENYINAPECNSSSGGCTLAVYTKEQIENIVSKVNDIALSYSSDNFTDFYSARENTMEIPGWDGTIIDLWSLADNLYSIPATFDLKNTIDNIYKVLINTDLKGISIYFPKTYPSDFECYSATVDNPQVCTINGVPVSNYYNPFAENSWDEFLSNYYQDLGN